jgi:hypothetical protein
MGEPIRKSLEEPRLGETDCDVGAKPNNLQKRVEQVLEGVGLGSCKAFENVINGGWLREDILNTCHIIL